jgi:hypothetical protein
MSALPVCCVLPIAMPKRIILDAAAMLVTSLLQTMDAAYVLWAATAAGMSSQCVGATAPLRQRGASMPLLASAFLAITTIPQGALGVHPTTAGAGWVRCIPVLPFPPPMPTGATALAMLGSIPSWARASSAHRATTVPMPCCSCHVCRAPTAHLAALPPKHALLVCTAQT